MSDHAEPYLQRLEAVAERLRGLARPRPGLTQPDPSTGERWEAGQIWGHVNEFVPYWIEQIEDLLDHYESEPLPFGRSRDDPTRVAGIEEGRGLPAEKHLHWLEQHVDDLQGFLRAIPEWAWSKEIGKHQRLGLLTLEQMIEQYLVGHLEEHAQQLEGLTGS